MDSDCGHSWTSKSRSSDRLKGEGGELMLVNAGLEGCPLAGWGQDVSGDP